jgi:hypothetical protein
MLYLIDSSAKNSVGHNLEYLLRISETVASPYLILGNKELGPDKNPSYRPTFEFATWDFGRFGFYKKDRKEQVTGESRTLRSSISLLVTEKVIETLATFIAKFAGRFIILSSRYTKQSRCFYRDLRNGLSDFETGSTVLLSTMNARELVGLRRWANQFSKGSYSINVILRRPMLDLRSYYEIPFIFIDALIYISAIRELANEARFFADTPGLAARLTKRTVKTVEHVPALGFELQINIPKGPLEIAIAPNLRSETRFSSQDLTFIPELNAVREFSLDSKRYRDLLSTTKSILLPYDPLRYRLRSSGIFVEALTLGIIPVVPTGTSMSREISKLNSKVLQAPAFTVDLVMGGKIELGQFVQEDLIITLDANFYGSVVIEISHDGFNTRKSTHDFFESHSRDSFFIRPSKQTSMSFKVDRIYFQRGQQLNIKVYKTGNSLFGVPYLEGEIPSVLALLKTVTFCSIYQDEIGAHSPKSICDYLAI